MRRYSSNFASAVNLSRSKPGSRFAGGETAWPSAALLEKEILDEPHIRLVTGLSLKPRPRSLREQC